MKVGHYVMAKGSIKVVENLLLLVYILYREGKASSFVLLLVSSHHVYMQSISRQRRVY